MLRFADPANFDECELGVHECDINAICKNVPTSTYTCTCFEGYQGDGMRGGCALVNETATSVTKSKGSTPANLTTRAVTQTLTTTQSTPTGSAPNATVSKPNSTKAFPCTTDDPPSNVYKCATNPTVCLYAGSVLDGESDCPNGEDEGKLDATSRRIHSQQGREEISEFQILLKLMNAHWT